MSDLPSVASRIQVEETEFRAPVSESLAQKLGSTMNFILDHYVINPGTLTDFAGPESAVSSGWIVCDGRTLSRVTYANLFAVIGTYWGAGDGITTFPVPDLRGQFTRMVDLTLSGQKGMDPDHAFRTPQGTGTTEEPGSFQQDQFRQHVHHPPAQTGTKTGVSPFWQGQESINYDNATDSAGGHETRPVNSYVLKLIKT